MSSRLGVRGGVIVQNLPALAALLQQQRERPARSQRVAAVQREARRRKRQVGGQRAHVQLVERQRVAVFARSEVRRLVVIEQRLPAVLHVAAGDITGE